MVYISNFIRPGTSSAARLREAAQRPLINGHLATPETHGRSGLRAAVKLIPDFNLTDYFVRH